MKLAYLRDFIAVAETGSIRAGARRLNVTQPAITKSIRQLERELDATVFTRYPRGIALTEAGRAFLVRAKTVSAELERGVEEVTQLKGASSGNLAFGISASPSFLILSESLKNFRKRYPDVNVRIVGGGFQSSYPELRDGLLDFSLSPRPSGKLTADFHVENFFEFERVVVARRGHPLAKAKALADLVSSEWLVAGVNGLDVSEFRSIFSGLDLPAPRSITNCEYVPAYLSLLTSTDALMMLPKFWVETPMLSGSLVKIDVQDKFPLAEICVVRRRGLELTPAATHMLDLLHRAVPPELR